jgi:hypothetical protein
LQRAELCAGGADDCAPPASSAWRGGDAVTLLALVSGRATLCARWDGAAACAHVRVLPRLASAPTGLLRMTPSAHVRLRLWRLHEVGGEEEEVALPTASFLFLAANPRVLSVAMHHGRLDAVAAGKSKLIAVDVGAREAEASSDVRHAQYCAGEAWRAPAGIDECHSDDELAGGSLVRSVVVEPPVAAVLWVEPAAWPDWLQAGADGHAEPGAAFHTAPPDDDYQGGAAAATPLPAAARAARSGAVRRAPAFSASTKSGKVRDKASSGPSSTFQATPPGCCSTNSAASE